MINEDVAQEILHELFSSFEALETQCGAILQVLKDKGIAKEEDLAIYFEQAANASNVRWRAARVRMDHLLSGALKAAEQQPPSEPRKPPQNEQESAAKTGVQEHKEASSEKEQKEQSDKETQGTQKVPETGKSESNGESEIHEEQQVRASAGDNGIRENNRTSKRPERAARNESNDDAPTGRTA